MKDRAHDPVEDEGEYGSIQYTPPGVRDEDRWELERLRSLLRVVAMNAAGSSWFLAGPKLRWIAALTKEFLP